MIRQVVKRIPGARTMWHVYQSFFAKRPATNVPKAHAGGGAHEPYQVAVHTRKEKLTFDNALQGKGLEIGPCYSPLAPKKDGHDVEILDHATAEGLREKLKDDPAVNHILDRIEEVDYVWQGESLSQCTGKLDYYDWIAASHVIEHVPDLVGFVQECMTMLKDNGLLILAIPDKRCCFDFFRSTSTPGQVITAHVEKRKRHTLGTLWDMRGMMCSKKGIGGSFDLYAKGACVLNASLEDTLKHFKNVQKTYDTSDTYIDAHAWCFTPSAFKLMLNDVCALGWLHCDIKYFFDTAGNEFIVHLQKTIPPKRYACNRQKMVEDMFAESLEHGSLQNVSNAS